MLLFFIFLYRTFSGVRACPRSDTSITGVIPRWDKSRFVRSHNGFELLFAQASFFRSQIQTSAPCWCYLTSGSRENIAYNCILYLVMVGWFVFCIWHWSIKVGNDCLIALFYFCILHLCIFVFCIWNWCIIFVFHIWHRLPHCMCAPLAVLITFGPRFNCSLPIQTELLSLLELFGILWSTVILQTYDA